MQPLYAPMQSGEDVKAWPSLNAVDARSQNFISIHLSDIIWK